MIAYICLAKEFALDNSERFPSDESDWAFIHSMLISGGIKQSDLIRIVSDTYVVLDDFQFSSIIPFDKLSDGDDDNTFGFVDFYVVVQSFFSDSTFGVNRIKNEYKHIHTLLKDDMDKEVFIRAFVRTGVSYEFASEFRIHGKVIEYMPNADSRVEKMAEQLCAYKGAYIAYLILRK